MEPSAKLRLEISDSQQGMELLIHLAKPNDFTKYKMHEVLLAKFICYICFLKASPSGKKKKKKQYAIGNDDTSCHQNIKTAAPNELKLLLFPLLKIL